MKDNHKTTSERIKELNEAVKALYMALHDMAKNLSDFINVVDQNGIEKCKARKN